ncbi:50S ribosomal protein L10 [Rhodonellum psychrophilum GCM71 = DSM 17998]|jgi:large subunit ribosomal protein L10|uniref:Large ribosomal subunit protein uL10 n=2 Tax=Rhodonellum TaxID=336827 RepID=U5C563_9BACT|nr:MULTISPECIES: 50S ribosomal protein L10 [Rhodonellum]ERM84939.1 50S ribosomal protein L10 [Rhodonellum psychrophilum GCM71 = DSM 17998]MDO9551993.1 50S ribosomal protein L10 [Rhodonellum sp.]SDY74274.1 LSU ribosomal protein L10P [Rhodonellum ikkaensis]
MTREEKSKIIEGLTEKFKENPYFYITNASGFSVAQVNAFRRSCFDKGVEYKVYKNTLIKKALENLETDYTEFAEKTLKGFSGVMFSKELGNLPAKVLLDFRKKQGKKETRPLFKGASIDSSLYIGEEQLELLSNLKTKNELIGDVIGLLQSPAKNVISALKSGQNTLAGLVKTLSEREQ